jgi:hypothetical protein
MGDMVVKNIHTVYSRQKWCTTAGISTFLIIVYLLWNLYFISQHYYQLIEKNKQTFTRLRNEGQDMWKEVCAAKPSGFKTDLIDCVKAHEWRQYDIETVAHNEAIRHLHQHDLTLGNLILGCHGTEVCDTFLARMLAVIANQFTLLVWTILIVGVAVILLISLPGNCLFRLWKTRKEFNRRMALSERGTTQIPAALKLFQSVKEERDLADFVRRDSTIDQMSQTLAELRNRRQNNPSQSVFIEGEEQQQQEGQPSMMTMPTTTYTKKQADENFLAYWQQLGGETKMNV